MPRDADEFPSSSNFSLRCVKYARPIADLSGSPGPSLPSHIDRYEVLSLLGSGSFAAVYLAHDPALDAPVAIKVLAEHHSFDHEVRGRFINEGRLLRQMPGERLVTVHDIGERNGQPFIVMEALPAGTLEDRLGGVVPPPHELRHLIAEVGACLEALEAGGVVHRDFKPSNLLIRSHEGGGTVLSENEQLVLGDFGLARSNELTGLTVGGGTEGYLAPEQRRPSTVIDHRCDIYGATAVIADVAHRRPDGGGADGVTGNDRFAEALRRGLAEDPADRPQSAKEWTELLLHAVAQSAPAPASASADAGRDGRGRGLVLALVAAVALAVGGLVFLAGGDDSTSEPVEQISEDGPQIIGPNTLLVGEPGTYLHPVNRPGVTYQWTLPSGERSTDPEIVLVPTSADDLVLLLTSTDEGIERTSRLEIDVRNQ